MTKFFRGGFLLFLVILFSFKSDTNKFTFAKKAQLAICIDFSQSATDVLMAFKNNYWKLWVDHYNKLPDTKLEVSIVGYSSNSFGKKVGYVKVLSNFEDDPYLFFNYLHTKKLTSTVSDNNIGSVVRLAASDLHWDTDPKVKKQILVIGNGPITDSKKIAIEADQIARKKGVKVNALYLLYKKKDKSADRWRQLVELTGGKMEILVKRFLNEQIAGEVKKNNKIANDANALLNKTYWWYGKNGKANHELMLLTDSFAKESSLGCYEGRMIYKGTPYFQDMNVSWDLVDFYNTGKMNVFKLDRDFLYGKLGNYSHTKISRDIKARAEERIFYLEIIDALKSNNKAIRDSTESDQPAYKKYLSKTIINFMLDK